MSYKRWFGCDVSSEKLDFSEYDGINHRMFQIENKKSAIARYFKKYSKSQEIHVIMEATGIYNRILFIELLRLEIPVSVVNPLIIKRFSQMKLLRAKTDQVDARLIAEYGYNQKPALSKMPPKIQESIFSIFKTVQMYHKQRSIVLNNIHVYNRSGSKETIILKELKKTIRSYKRSIDLLEQKIHDLVEEHYQSVYNRLVQIPGVARKTASVIIGFFGEFENFETAKQVVSFVGLNPNPRMSGKSVRLGSSISKRGNPLIRKMLYMSALTAMRYNPDCKELYDRLLNRGTSKVKAQVAVAHKLLRQIFAIVKYEREWVPNYAKRC